MTIPTTISDEEYIRRAEERIDEAKSLLLEIGAHPRYLRAIHAAIEAAYYSGYKRGANVALAALGAEPLSEDL